MPPWILPLIELVKRYAQTPEQKLEAERLAAQVEVEFIKATTPDANRVYIWVNSLIALVRPAVTILIVAMMVFDPQRLLLLVKGFADAGMAGWIVLSPVLWWYFGRDLSKLFALKFNGGVPVGSGASEPQKPERNLN